MSFAIISPPNSFVDFNPPAVNNCLEQPDTSLPAFNDFGIQFQFQVVGDLLASSKLKVVITDGDGNKILDQNIFAQNLCYEYRVSVTQAMFPFNVPAGQAIPEGTYEDMEYFMATLGNYLGLTLPSTVFDYCCLFPSLSIATSSGAITFDRYWDFGFAAFPPTMMGGLLMNNDCFRYGIADAGGNVLAISNKFRRVMDSCFSTLITYWNDDDAFGFSYPTLAYANTVRLPFTFRKPVYPVTEQVYVKSDGSIKRASSRVNKEYEGYTDVLTEYFHERIIVALKHDHVQFTNSDIGLLAKELFVEGDYKPEWPDDNTVVVAPAKFKISVPISNINSNCNSQVSVPCCPPFLVSAASDDTSVTFNFDYGVFVTMVNLRYRISGTMAWTTVNNIQGKSFTVNNLTPGTDIEYQFQSVCGAIAGSWSHSYTQDTTGSPAVSCDGSLSGIIFTQTGDGAGNIVFTPAGSATQWKYSIDGVAAGTVSTPLIPLSGLAIGNHVVLITPVCTGGALGTPSTGNFAIAALPSITEISNGDTGPGGTRVQVFQIGDSVSPGNRFTLTLYSHVVQVIAVLGDTPTSIASKLSVAVDSTDTAQWNEFGAAPAGGAPGYPPHSTARANQITLNLNTFNNFLGNAYIS